MTKLGVERKKLFSFTQYRTQPPPGTYGPASIQILVRTMCERVRRKKLTDDSHNGEAGSCQGGRRVLASQTMDIVVWDDGDREQMLRGDEYEVEFANSGRGAYVLYQRGCR